jgi:hypothetical protein
MRFRTGLVVGGVIGYLVAREVTTRRDGDEDRAPGVRAAMARHPSNRIALQGRKIAERAGARSAQAIQRARANIQKRMDPDVDDLSLN